MSEEKWRSLIEPLVVIKSYRLLIALEPNHMGLGPVVVVPVALKKAGMELKDIDLIELNEAFAGQVDCLRQRIEPG